MRFLARVLTGGIAVALIVGWASTARGARPVVVTPVSADPYQNATSQHATEVEPDSFAFHGRVVAAFQVGRFFDGGATNIGWATSSNGGVRFERGFLPGITKYAGGPYDRVSDPSVAYDAAHGVWLISSLALVEGPKIRGAAIVVSRSRDGVNWEPPVAIPTPVASRVDVDKNWTVCDNHPASPFYGHCYTQFDNFGEADRIKMSTSVDGGLTWSAPAETADRALGLGGQPVVQPDGTVIVPIPFLSGSPLQAFRSTDGGQSWSATVSVTETPAHVVAGGLRTGVLPSADVDRTGKVYVAWQDCSFRAGCAANDIVISATTDGIDWSPTARVPIDPIDSTADHFIPGLAVDPSSSGDHARLALTYYEYPQANCTVASAGSRSVSSPPEMEGRPGARPPSWLDRCGSIGCRRLRRAAWWVTTSRPRSSVGGRCRCSPTRGHRKARCSTSGSRPSRAGSDSARHAGRPGRHRSRPRRGPRRGSPIGSLTCKSRGENERPPTLPRSGR